MRIASAAIRYIAIPSPKAHPFGEGFPPKRNKRKLQPRLLTRVLSSAPIRRIGKHISKRSSKKSSRKDKFEKESNDEQKPRDLEQGWIAPAATFETEDTLSPRSFDSLTASDSTSCLLQTEQNEEDFLINCSILHSSNEFNPDQFLDLEAAINESAGTGLIIEPDLYENTLDIEDNENTPELCEKENEEEKVLYRSILPSSHQIYSDQISDLEAVVNESAYTSTIFRMENDEQDNTQCIENTPETCEKQNAAPHPEEESDKECEDSSIEHFVSSNHISMNDDETITIEKKAAIIINKYSDIRSPDANSRGSSIESLMSVIDTTTTIDEDNEIDSLVPAADISFFLNDGGDDFHCVGRLSTYTNEAPPIEINVDAETMSEFPKNSIEKENQEHNLENYDDISITSSHNSYLEAIESITASAKSDVERAMLIAIDEVKIKSSPPKKQDIGFEEDYYRVSFNASNTLLIQAMEGASAKAKFDIERATSLALSKYNSARSESSKSETFGKPNVTTKPISNKVLGFLLLIFFLFNFNGNPLEFFWGMQTISHSLGIDEFQYNHIALEPNSDLSMWTEMQANSTASSEMNYENAYNIGCSDKIGCLALGNI